LGKGEKGGKKQVGFKRKNGLLDEQTVLRNNKKQKKRSIKSE
jgi:hypothetical protein